MINRIATDLYGTKTWILVASIFVMTIKLSGCAEDSAESTTETSDQLADSELEVITYNKWILKEYTDSEGHTYEFSGVETAYYPVEFVRKSSDDFRVGQYKGQLICNDFGGEYLIYDSVLYLTDDIVVTADSCTHTPPSLAIVSRISVGERQRIIKLIDGKLTLTTGNNEIFTYISCSDFTPFVPTSSLPDYVYTLNPC